jgi:hypothetical protein
MRRPTPQRMADLHRAKAWPFISWCVVAGHLRADLELLLAKPGGVDLPTAWAAEHDHDVRQVAEVGRRFGWSANWIRQVSVLALPITCLWAGKTLWELSEDDFTAVLAELERVAHVSASARMPARACSPSSRPATSWDRLAVRHARPALPRTARPTLPR